MDMKGLVLQELRRGPLYNDQRWIMHGFETLKRAEEYVQDRKEALGHNTFFGNVLPDNERGPCNGSTFMVRCSTK